ncbi:hypothetical protein AB0C77_23570, partial [Streptomyces sp. NPDC048629]|uniref:hypothetical protein n=1 Tax=Streptomyces sp. NPDC048629 TaxID=3154824 RepID=UPI003415F345
MADIEVPDWAEPILGGLGGQPWPHLSESALIAESLFWEEMARHVRGMKAEFAGSAFGAARTMEGDGARALEASLRKFTEE